MSVFGDFYTSAQRYGRGRRKFLEIKNDPQKKATCVKYGVSGCLFAVFGFAIGFLSFLGASALTDSGAELLTGWIAYIPLLAIAFMWPLCAFIAGVLSASRQLRLGKKFGGVLGLILNLISVALYVPLIALL